MESINCDLCGSFENPDILTYQTYFLHLLETQYKVCRCRTCKLVYMNPRPSREELNKVYNIDYLDKNFYDMESLNKRRMREVYQKKIQTLKKIKSSGKILDIGAGIGGFIYLAKKAGYDVEGLEVSSSEVALAKKKYGIDLKHGILSQKDYCPGTFDIIHMHHVLEHVFNPTETLMIIFNLLKIGGYFYFEIPNDFHSSVFYYNRLKKILGKDSSFSKPSIHHLYFFDYNTILKYINKIKFKIIFIEGKFHEVNFKYRFTKKLIQTLTFPKKFAPAFEILCQKR